MDHRKNSGGVPQTGRESEKREGKDTFWRVLNTYHRPIAS